MEKIKKPYNKLMIYTYLEVGLLILSFVLASLCSFLAYYNLKGYYGIFTVFTFIVVAVILVAASSIWYIKAFNAEIKRHKNYMVLNSNVDKDTFLKELEVVSNQIFIKTFVEKKKIDTICFYYLNTRKEYYRLRNEARTYLHKKYKITTYFVKGELKQRRAIEVLIVDGVLKHKLDTTSIRTDNKMSVILDNNTNQIYVPFFKEKGLTYLNMFNYDKTFNFLVDLFKVDKIVEQ